jgi:hypothetical protein
VKKVVILYRHKEEPPRNRTIKSIDQKAIDLKFLSTYEKQSHELPIKRNIHNLQVRGRKQTKSIIKIKA